MNAIVYNEEELRNVETALGITLSERNKYLLQTDRYSEMIEGIEDPSDKAVKRNARIHLYRNAKKEVGVNLYYKKEALVIPDYIGKYKLTSADKQQLLLGNVVQIKNEKNQNLYIQVDKELNAIIVKGDRELEIPDVVGQHPKFGYDGYSLKDDDKLKLANGGILEPKVMCGDEGFFLARLGITDDKKGYIIMDYQTIPQEKVQEYIDKYNKPQEFQLTEDKAMKARLSEAEILSSIQNYGFRNLPYAFETLEQQNIFTQKYGIQEHYAKWLELSKAYDLNLFADNNSAMDKLYQQMQEVEKEAKDIISQKVQDPELEQEHKINRDLDKEFNEALDKHDFEKLNQLANEGYKPADHQLGQIESIPGLSENDKIAVKAIFNVNEEAPALQQSEKKNPSKNLEIKTGEEKTNLSQQPREEREGDSRRVEKIGNIANQAFQQM